MIDYMRMHYDYILTKTLVTLVIVLICLILVNDVYASQILDGYGYIDAHRDTFSNDYFNEAWMVREYILVFISIFIAMGLSNKQNKALMVYTVVSRKTKIYFITSRIIIGCMLMTLIWVTQTMTFYAITLGFTPYQLELGHMINLSLSLLIELLQYHILTMFLMALTQFNLVGLIPLIIFWLIEVTHHSSLGKINNLIQSFMVNINGYHFDEKSMLIYVIVFIFLTINYIIVLLKRDC
jgi:hypothetical protein